MRQSEAVSLFGCPLRSAHHSTSYQAFQADHPVAGLFPFSSTRGWLGARPCQVENHSSKGRRRLGAAEKAKMLGCGGEAMHQLGLVARCGHSFALLGDATRTPASLTAGASNHVLCVAPNQKGTRRKQYWQSTEHMFPFGRCRSGVAGQKSWHWTPLQYYTVHLV